jgi:hypothetical protein
VNRHANRIAIGSLLAAAMFLSPGTAFAQRWRAGVFIRPAVVVAPYYRPWFYDPFYFGAFYGYPPPYAYGPAFDVGSSLRLQVTPRETEVFIDGYFAGIVDDFDGFLQRLRLAPGEHDLQLYLPGHRLVEQKIYLQRGATFRVHYAMELLAPGEAEPVRPAAAAPPPVARAAPPRPLPPARPLPPPRSLPASGETGALALRVQPGDAVIIIDGERWEGSRDADRLVVQLPPGVHRVEIHRDGYRDYSSDVTVRQGETEALNVALAR